MNYMTGAENSWLENR